mmetsp:Transcript_17944/g.25551  ORF Transcript_17944/g.25551 Transcript_17944/m.25551 type:complete len:583 (+) Transcript_17944:193-1941(+)|eukprot:CAMPEP_0172434472 /NCGR_PEP_ID=MMETSP1064-20121228/70653_1 /TAXON_ID=202472 /ORGANISM="Aulacoseira subarctica , Strain CCAP 1002/5" /LENGTH=582 /DNA_ID=CAMNT_0013182699 /DNA_START=244 /DNA_END=1992 /DNA_ORIENTATION=+
MTSTSMLQRMNEKIHKSFVGRLFQFEERKASFTTEFKAGCTTFLSMAYILAVNPRIMADSGGPCVVPDGGTIFSPEYEQCLVEIQQQYVTATALCSMMACFLMGFLANLPIALSTGMGLNAFFTYSVVGFRGTGNVSYQAAVTAVLIEGFIFLFLGIVGARYWLVKLIPEPIRIATPAGIGAFLAHIGFQSAEGLGVVVANIATAVTLGACPPESRTPIVAYDELCATQGICIPGSEYVCQGGVMTSARTWLGLVGLFITGVMLSYRRKSAFAVGILFVTFISWFRNTAVTYFPDTAEGDERFAFFSKVVSIQPVNLIVGQFTNNLSDVTIALITMLYVDFLDASGTLYGLAKSLEIVDSEGNFPRSRLAFSVDAVSAIIASCFGMSPVTAYIESASGVEVGGRTGLTAVFVGFYFFLAVFFAPLLASIPPWATGGTLVIVGSLMFRSLVDIKWSDPPHAITAFITVMLMPLTYSIAYGLIGGMMVWFSMQAVFFVLKKVFKIERYKAPHAFREVGMHEMKDLIKEAPGLEIVAQSMINQSNTREPMAGIDADSTDLTAHKDPQEDCAVGKQDDVESAVEKI